MVERRDETSAARGTVSGRVQGVGFRWFVVRQAESLQVSGWVRNLPDGRVEFHAQGRRQDVAALLEMLRVGPRGARVDHVTSSEEPSDPSLRSFSVR